MKLPTKTQVQIPEKRIETLTWTNLKDLEMGPLEYILKGLARAEIGMLQAITNAGKTTLSLNLSICLATGRDFLPLIEASEPRKVFYIDYETPLEMIRDDLERMESVLDDQEKALLGQNLLIYSALYRESDDLLLTEDWDRSFVAKRALEFGADLIIIDPITIAFRGIDEQSNSEVINGLFGSLRQIIKTAGGPGILFTHHIGKEKSEEGAVTRRGGAYRSRGASSFGGFSRLILQLDHRTIQGQTELVLSCEKIKGPELTETVLSLDMETRWFTSGDKEVAREDSTVDELVATIEEMGGEAKRVELLARLATRMSTATVDRCLKSAINKGLIEKSQHGIYNVVRQDSEGIEEEWATSLVESTT